MEEEVSIKLGVGWKGEGRIKLGEGWKRNKEEIKLGVEWKKK